MLVNIININSVFYFLYWVQHLWGNITDLVSCFVHILIIDALTNLNIYINVVQIKQHLYKHFMRGNPTNLVSWFVQFLNKVRLLRVS